MNRMLPIFCFVVFMSFTHLTLASHSVDEGLSDPKQLTLATSDGGCFDCLNADMFKFVTRKMDVQTAARFSRSSKRNRERLRKDPIWLEVMAMQLPAYDEKSFVDYLMGCKDIRHRNPAVKTHVLPCLLALYEDTELQSHEPSLIKLVYSLRSINFGVCQQFRRLWEFRRELYNSLPAEGDTRFNLVSNMLEDIARLQSNLPEKADLLRVFFEWEAEYKVPKIKFSISFFAFEINRLSIEDTTENVTAALRFFLMESRKGSLKSLEPKVDVLFGGTCVPLLRDFAGIKNNCLEVTQLSVPFYTKTMSERDFIKLQQHVDLLSDNDRKALKRISSAALVCLSQTMGLTEVIELVTYSLMWRDAAYFNAQVLLREQRSGINFVFELIAELNQYKAEVRPKLCDAAGGLIRPGMRQKEISDILQTLSRLKVYDNDLAQLMLASNVIRSDSPSKLICQLLEVVHGYCDKKTKVCAMAKDKIGTKTNLFKIKEILNECARSL